jgi:hypothetical protein
VNNKPVWIKYWGLIPMTRRGYVVTLTMVAALAGIVVVYCALAGWLPPLRTLWEPDAVRVPTNFFGWVYRHLWWIVIACLIAQIIDTCLVLRQFAGKEREQAAQEAGPPAQVTSEAVREKRP